MRSPVEVTNAKRPRPASRRGGTGPKVPDSGYPAASNLAKWRRGVNYWGVTPTAFLVPTLLFLALGALVVLRGARLRHANHHRTLVAVFLAAYLLAWVNRFFGFLR